MRVLQALLLLVAAQVAMAPANAQQRVIRFGLTGDYPPFAERGADGALRGADILVANRIAADLGARAEFVPTTWQTLLADFTAGKFDVGIGGLTVTPERAAVGTYSIALMQDGKRPLARCAERRRYRTLADIDRAEVRVQVNRGPGVATLVKALVGMATVTVNPDDATLIPALLERRADVWITDGAVVDHMARRYPGKLCATTDKPFTHVTKAWLIRRDPALIAEIDAGLKRALASGMWLRALKAVR